MQIALIGYGQTGRVVEEVAGEQDVGIVARFTSKRPLEAADENRQTLAGITALVDFSTPEAVVPTVRAAAGLSLDMVIGTTGWQKEFDTVREIVEGAGIGVVWASNFSLGVNLFYRIAERAAQLFGKVEGYDPFIQDWHHRFKKDSPSGTALEIRKHMAAGYGERAVPITSVRAGYVPSVHSVTFDSTGDSVRLEHSARNRRGFAEGALLAARWIRGRRGLFAFGDVLDDLYSNTATDR